MDSQDRAPVINVEEISSSVAEGLIDHLKAGGYLESAHREFNIPSYRIDVFLHKLLFSPNLSLMYSIKKLEKNGEINEENK